MRFFSLSESIPSIYYLVIFLVHNNDVPFKVVVYILFMTNINKHIVM